MKQINIPLAGYCSINTVISKSRGSIQVFFKPSSRLCSSQWYIPSQPFQLLSIWRHTKPLWKNRMKAHTCGVLMLVLVSYIHFTEEKGTSCPLSSWVFEVHYLMGIHSTGERVCSSKELGFGRPEDAQPGDRPHSFPLCGEVMVQVLIKHRKHN